MVRVGYLTVVYDDTLSEKAARHITNEAADMVLSLPAVDAVKCDIGVLDGGTEKEFWRVDG